MLVHRKVTPQHYIAGTHLYTWVERDNVEQSFSSKETTRRQRPGSNHRPSALTTIWAIQISLSKFTKYK